MNDDELVKILAESRQDETPPSEIEVRTVAGLRAAGFIRRELQAPLRAGLLTVAAIAAALLIGVWIGTRHGTGLRSSQPKFLLMLYQGANYQPFDSGGVQKRRAVYNAWFRSLAQTGHALDGEALTWGGAELQPNRPPAPIGTTPVPDQPDGFFIITATDENAALAIAETCPHLRFGGRIIMRPIEP